MALSNKKIALIVAAAVFAVLLLCLAAVVVAINLYASGGGDNIEIPDVVGLTVAEARDAITIRTEIVIVDADVPEGMVVGQSHPAGTKTHHDDIVRLEVSGPLVVPDVVGLDVRDVWKVLYREGFDEMTYDYDPESSEPPGTVLEQDPQAGDESETGEIWFLIAGEDPYP
jgi:serine/threonine-protein kinase